MKKKSPWRRSKQENAELGCVEGVPTMKQNPTHGQTPLTVEHENRILELQRLGDEFTKTHSMNLSKSARAIRSMHESDNIEEAIGLLEGDVRKKLAGARNSSQAYENFESLSNQVKRKLAVDPSNWFDEGVLAAAVAFCLHSYHFSCSYRA